jgi:hypothetical protein
MRGEYWQVTIMRQVLDDFCAQHDLSVKDRPAIEAAELLMRFVADGEVDPAELRDRLDDAMVDRPFGRRSVAEPRAGAGL